MYFIVFLVKDRKTIIVPKNWIKNIDEQIEKFINNGLNSNQRMLCFWTDDVAAFENGKPKHDFLLDPKYGLAESFPATGWHICKIKRAKGNFFIYLMICGVSPSVSLPFLRSFCHFDFFRIFHTLLVTLVLT